MSKASLNISGRKLGALNFSGRSLSGNLNFSGRVITDQPSVADILSISPATVSIRGAQMSIVEGANPDSLVISPGIVTVRGATTSIKSKDRVSISPATVSIAGQTISIVEGSSSTLKNDLVYWYTGENANDSHTGVHHLTPVNSPTHVAGKIGNCFQPAKTGSKFWRIISSSAAHADPGTSDFSIAFWTKGGTGSGNDGLIAIGDPNSIDAGFDISTNKPGNILVYISDGTTRISKLFVTALGTGSFSHIVLTFDRSGNLSLYKNKVLVDTRDISALDGINIVSGADFLIGSSDSFGKNDVPLDEVAQWNRLLTTDEIADLYDNELTYSDL